ncbi:RNA polymerase sigma factor WhiG [Treponema putidum]|uniref:RNA polymerase sigma factor WhiG n=1 Tax=Treponema putidum TaxID=221027 RepID=A0AAE9SI90_9SPIR|nr:RNA polymerase sigma factor WhiG [Treponema putidum]AIN93683.1 RNA polymerase sigma70 [Treponema putidum]TWI77780.1 RNA polymerase sigma-28 (SigD/FliA/WhiG) subunit [Treponema putidum]UTY29928.1 RNA polymerase sigma factor WhiG [Treponema putidum]UTY32380.1 RNA polymerase sigma factor WhiG [Treponema putidum]UTY34788.1 RNA polymerase sigma factor WhiG [Treponema putidum]
MANTDYENIPEDELWEKYKKTSDPKIREYFILKYAPLVKYVAGKIGIGMPTNVEFDDLVGYGVFGLLDAIEKYDLDKNVKFNTYAVNRIRGAIFDELRSIDWVPRSVRQKSREIEETIADLEARLGRSASNEEIAHAMGLDIEEYNSLLLKISGTNVISLTDLRFSNDDSEEFSVGDIIESPSSLNPDVIVEREDTKRVISEALKELPEREKKVLIMYYYEDMTLREIGEVLHVTESRVSQIHTSANVKLKAKLSNVTKGIK